MDQAAEHAPSACYPRRQPRICITAPFRLGPSIEQDEALAPAIWPLEGANGLRTAERRGRLDLADMAHVRELLVSLPIQVEGVLLGEVKELARQLDLTANDAAYLALAARRGVALARRSPPHPSEHPHYRVRGPRQRARRCR